MIFVLVLAANSISPASAAVTWSQTSTLDTTFDGSVYNSQYDLEYTSAYIFDNDTDAIYFYLDFAKVPTVNMFNDGNSSYAVIYLDYDFNNKADAYLFTDDVTLETDSTSVQGLATTSTGGVATFSNCKVSVFGNIAKSQKWIGFKTSRTCIGLPKSFGLRGGARYNSKNSENSYDFAPLNYFRVNLPTTTTGGSTATSIPDVGATFTLPSTKANDSTAANSYSESPQDLSKLSEDLLPSVVTVQCDGGSGTGWSADVAMSTDLLSAGYKSLVLTNHHVIENCLTNKSVTVVLNSKVSLPGTIVSWGKYDDIAGVAVKTTIPALQWVGSNPKQGWWVGVLGSPLGVSGILTTGIISSTNSMRSTFTFTAAINPGNSGGPVFDSTGRVLGLASSKNLISTDLLAEGFGNAQGTPLLCSIIVSCVIEKNPWNGTPKYAASSALVSKAASDAAAKIAQDKAVADAKAAAEAAAKIALDKAVADAKTASDAAAKIALDKAVADAKAAAEAAAKIALDKAVADAKAVAEAIAKVDLDKVLADNRVISEQLTKLQGDYSTLNTSNLSYLSKYSEAMTQIEALKGNIQSLQAQVAELLKPRPETIVCKKGTNIKVVKALSPKCPTGYKKV